jgi:hypothetical protein
MVPVQSITNFGESATVGKYFMVRLLILVSLVTIFLPLDISHRI